MLLKWAQAVSECQSNAVVGGALEQFRYYTSIILIVGMILIFRTVVTATTVQ